jgi:hypothetical protein
VALVTVVVVAGRGGGGTREGEARAGGHEEASEVENRTAHEVFLSDEKQIPESVAPLPGECGRFMGKSR